MQVHNIRLLGATVGDIRSVIQIGALTISEDYVAFNPTLKGRRGMRWTYHKDGNFTCKDDDNNLITPQSQKPSFAHLSGPVQMLSDAFPIEDFEDQQIPYKVANVFTHTWMIDMAYYTSRSHIVVSTFLCRPDDLLQTMNMFTQGGLGSDASNIQSFCFTQSNPCIVAHFYSARS